MCSLENNCNLKTFFSIHSILHRKSPNQIKQKPKNPTQTSKKTKISIPPNQKKINQTKNLTKKSSHKYSKQILLTLFLENTSEHPILKYLLWLHISKRRIPLASTWEE